MPDSVGNRLCKARLARGLTIDEAAHATKMRPDKILALENDDYSRFGNSAYAKGFLLIYGRFLRVDVSEQVRSLEMPNDIRVAEYQYLSNAPPLSPSRVPRHGRSRKPSLAPLIAFAGLLVLAALGFYLYVTAKRLGTIDSSRKASATETTRPSSQEAAANSGPAGAQDVPAANAPPPTVASVASPNAQSAAPSSPGSSAIIAAVPITPVPQVAPQNTSPSAPIPAPPPGLEVRRAEAAAPVRLPATPPSAAPPGGVHEVTVEAVKKTWVKICRDNPDSPPIFMDYIYPKAGALKLRGARFYIEARDPGAIQVHKNGAPIAYQAPGIIVQ